VANSLQAKKRARQNNVRRLHNTSLRSQVRTSRKKFIAALESGDIELATATFKKTSQILDKHAGSSIIHKNTVARYKSRASAALKNISTTTAKPSTKKATKSKK
jgi:small subunit ribosomal protein S20